MRMPASVRRVGAVFLDFFYPPSCVSCQRMGRWLCPSCWARLDLFLEPRRAPVLPSGRAPLVPNVWALFSYANTVGSALIRTYKYQSAFCLEVVFAECIAAYRRGLEKRWPFSRGESWQLVSIPTDPAHLRRRGMDHAARLACVWQKTVFPEAVWIEPLKRTEGEQANAELEDHRYREVNVLGKFSCAPVSGSILLIDDVYTSGATTQAVAQLLYEAGASRVEILVCAIGS